MNNFRARLEDEKYRLEGQMKSIGRARPGVPNDFEARPTITGSEPDPIDQAEVIQSYEENEGLLRDLEARYDAVLTALGRLDAGTYGICSVCGAPIEPERLAADPAATTCTAHAQ